MSWRRLGVLIQQLPPESALARVTAGEHWTQEHELLASIYDRLSIQVWQAAGKVSAPKPKPFPRPTDKAKCSRTSLTAGEVHARLVAQREAQRQRDGEVNDARC